MKIGDRVRVVGLRPHSNLSPEVRERLEQVGKVVEICTSDHLATVLFEDGEEYWFYYDELEKKEIEMKKIFQAGSALSLFVFVAVLSVGPETGEIETWQLVWGVVALAVSAILAWAQSQV